MLAADQHAAVACGNGAEVDQFRHAHWKPLRQAARRRQECQLGSLKSYLSQPALCADTSLPIISDRQQQQQHVVCVQRQQVCVPLCGDCRHRLPCKHIGCHQCQERCCLPAAPSPSLQPEGRNSGVVRAVGLSGWLAGCSNHACAQCQRPYQLASAVACRHPPSSDK